MTKFADMPSGSRNGWVAWAQSHDWAGPAAWYDDMTGEMVCYSSEHDGFSWHVVEARFTEPKAMKEWAGY